MMVSTDNQPLILLPFLLHLRFQIIPLYSHPRLLYLHQRQLHPHRRLQHNPSRNHHPPHPHHHLLPLLLLLLLLLQTRADIAKDLLEAMDSVSSAPWSSIVDNHNVRYQQLWWRQLDCILIVEPHRTISNEDKTQLVVTFIRITLFWINKWWHFFFY